MAIKNTQFTIALLKAKDKKGVDKLMQNIDKTGDNQETSLNKSQIKFLKFIFNDSEAKDAYLEKFMPFAIKQFNNQEEDNSYFYKTPPITSTNKYGNQPLFSYEDIINNYASLPLYHEEPTTLIAKFDGCDDADELSILKSLYCLVRVHETCMLDSNENKDSNIDPPKIHISGLVNLELDGEFNTEGLKQILIDKIKTQLNENEKFQAVEKEINDSIENRNISGPSLGA